MWKVTSSCEALHDGVTFGTPYGELVHQWAMGEMFKHLNHATSRAIAFRMEQHKSHTSSPSRCTAVPVPTHPYYAACRHTCVLKFSTECNDSPGSKQQATKQCPTHLPPPTDVQENLLSSASRTHHATALKTACATHHADQWFLAKPAPEACSFCKASEQSSAI
jgi:hypothetical protein